MIFCNRICQDVEIVKHFPNMKNIQKENIKMVMISESFPKNKNDYFDGRKDSLFIKNTNFLFNQNGYDYKTYDDYLNNGIYLTTARKCIKKNYLVSAETIEECSHYPEREIECFTDTKVILLMGDFAIKSMNYIMEKKK